MCSKACNIKLPILAISKCIVQSIKCMPIVVQPISRTFISQNGNCVSGEIHLPISPPPLTAFTKGSLQARIPLRARVFTLLIKLQCINMRIMNNCHEKAVIITKTSSGLLRGLLPREQKDDSAVEMSYLLLTKSLSRVPVCQPSLLTTEGSGSFETFACRIL